MEIQILRNDRISDSGHSLIRAMDNPSMSVLDVFVREVIQNSLDASNTEGSVKVDFITGSFDPVALSGCLPYVESEMRIRYPDEKYDFIAVSDSGTSGLTGIDDMENEKTRLQGLVYHIAKDTKSKESGGSWGYGKTVFFRVGMGLVLFYSRVHENGRYVNLLAATLVEDEDADPMVKKENSRGISYFGRPDPKSKEVDPERRLSLPVTDDGEIKRILGIFGIPMYSEEKTGTVVIIPFINREKLLYSVRPRDSDDVPRWMHTLESCIGCLIQRWYAPRMNPEYNEGHRWLRASVNGDVITFEKMEKTFRLVQDLYLFAGEEISSGRVTTADLHREVIKETKFSSLPLGYVAWVCIEKTSLGLDDRPNWDVYSLVGRTGVENRSCVVTYVRKPGMLIRYDTSSDWCPNIAIDENCILIALFRLNSDAIIKGSTQTLEEYVRSCELRAHDSWNDESHKGIIQSISKKTLNVLKKAFETKPEPKKESESSLSRIFTEAFLPPMRFTQGVGSAPQGASSGAHGRTKSRRSGMTVQSSRISDEGREMVIDVTLGTSDYTILRFVLDSETGSLDPNDWEDTMGKPSPIWISRVDIVGTGTSRGSIVECRKEVNLQQTEDAFLDFKLRVLKTSEHGIPFGIIISGSKGSKMRLSIILSTVIHSLSIEPKLSSGGGES